MNRQLLNLKKAISAIIMVFVFAPQQQLFSQSPCMPTVPSFTVNLTGNPSGVWTSPNIARKDLCCTNTAPDECIYFHLTLDPNAAGIQIDMIGADPPGSLFYDIGCTGNYPGGTIKCITGVGPHLITFCKPGGNKNIYKITSISKPLFPKDDTMRIGCKYDFVTLGVVNSSVTWQSIYPGTPGQYNSYLDSTNVACPTYSPGSGAPPYIDYKVCGFPLASNCGFSVTVCDTVRIYNFPGLTSGVTPNPASFCNVGPNSGVTLNANASGGVPAYSYTWTNSSNVVVGNGSTYFASAAGSYNLVVRDQLYDPVNCPATLASISVTQGTVPVVDAGPSKKVCASNPVVSLNGTVQFAPGGIWSGGGGTFNPGNTFLNTNYTPSAAELSAGFVKLYLTSATTSGCTNKKDSVIIYYSSTPTVAITGAALACHNSTTTLNANVTGGTNPYTYLWNTGSTNNFIFIGQGNYSVLVRDSLGCTGSSAYNLIAPAALNISFSVTNVSVNGGNDGSATVTATGGTPVYSVTWTPGNQNTFSISNLIYGVYTATVTDANGCQMAGSTVVNEPRCLGFSASTTSTHVSCNGTASGSASVTVTGGTPVYTYTWNTNPVQNTANATGLYAGVYTAVIKDANNCYQSVNVIITEPTMLINTMTSTNVTTIGGNNGAASANPFGGMAPYTYSWSTGATTSSISNLFAGTYTVSIADNNGCVKTDSVKILQPPCSGLTLNVFSNNVSCFGGSNGSAFAVVSGAIGSYTIGWSNGSFGPSVTGLTAGNYSVSITDSQNCLQFANFSVVQPSQLSVGLQPVNVRCNGTGDGSINLNVSGGIYPYSFLWNTSSTAEDLVNLTPGTYSVQITDANGCSAVASAVITEPTPIAVTYTSQNVSCIYGNNGAIGLNVTGGSVPYTYTWSTSATTSSISNVSAGGYTVIVKDANNCTLTQPLILAISQPDSVKIDSMIVACSVPGSGQTQVTIVPGGGYSGTFQVSYNNGVTYQPAGVYTAMLNNSTTYTIVLKDGNNCLSLVPFTLSIKPEVKIDSIIYAKCYAVGTGSVPAFVYPSGGDNGPYLVSFNNGISYLPAGTYSANVPVASSYTVIVKDARGCISAIQVITLPAVLNSTATVTSSYNGQNVSCNGSSNGTALVTASGGTGAYSYIWTSVPTQTTATANNLAAGTYSVIVTDGNNCSITQTVTLTQPTTVTATAIATSNYNGQNISCFGYSDGSASVTPGNGTGPYTYAWNSVPVQTSAAATGLSAGTYSVVVTDANNCTYTTTVMLTQPASISSTLSVVSNYNGQNISCFGAADGSATALASNGTAPFTYTWSTSPVQTGTVATGLTAGSWSVVITDANGCNYTRTITLTEPNAFNTAASVTSDYNGQNISCFGSSDGSANANASGGTAPYTYSWSTVPAQLMAGATNLTAGSYTVIATDINGCQAQTAITINQPQPISTSKQVGTLKCYGDSIGSINLTPGGGTMPYNYQWSNGASVSNLTGVNCGTYIVTITDANGCVLKDTTKMAQPDSLFIKLSSPLAYSGYNVSNYQGNDGSISCTVNGGVTPYNFFWSNGNSAPYLSNLAAGPYNVTVIDSNGCRVSAAIALTEPLILEMPQGYSPNNDGKNDFFVVHGIEAFPDNELTIFNRWGNIVYNKTGYTNDWDGTSNNGLALPDATYFAIFEVNKGETVLKGFVELRR